MVAQALQTEWTVLRFKPSTQKFEDIAVIAKKEKSSTLKSILDRKSNPRLFSANCTRRVIRL
jgi:hypothetical protein